MYQRLVGYLYEVYAGLRAACVVPTLGRSRYTISGGREAYMVRGSELKNLSKSLHRASRAFWDRKRASYERSFAIYNGHWNSTLAGSSDNAIDDQRNGRGNERSRRSRVHNSLSAVGRRTSKLPRDGRL